MVNPSQSRLRGWSVRSLQPQERCLCWLNHEGESIYRWSGDTRVTSYRSYCRARCGEHTTNIPGRDRNRVNPDHAVAIVLCDLSIEVRGIHVQIQPRQGLSIDIHLYPLMTSLADRHDETHIGRVACRCGSPVGAKQRGGNTQSVAGEVKFCPSLIVKVCRLRKLDSAAS